MLLAGFGCFSNMGILHRVDTSIPLVPCGILERQLRAHQRTDLVVRPRQLHPGTPFCLIVNPRIILQNLFAFFVFRPSRIRPFIFLNLLKISLLLDWGFNDGFIERRANGVHVKTLLSVNFRHQKASTVFFVPRLELRHFVVKILSDIGSDLRCSLVGLVPHGRVEGGAYSLIKYPDVLHCQMIVLPGERPILF